MLDVSLLGTGGMMPLPGRFLSSLLCRTDGKMLLIDCGEGTQITLKKLGWGFKNIEAIAITHFHADHISGLPGILLTIGNAGREEPLRMYGPRGLEHVSESLRIIVPELPFSIDYIEWPQNGGSEMFIPDVTLAALPLNHGTPCFAYTLTRRRRGRFDIERAKQGNVPMAVWSPLQKQDEIIYDGKRYTYDMVLGEPRKGLTVGYCTDTRPVPSLKKFMHNADLLVCEGLYGDADKKEKTAARKHMTFQEAAEIALSANVKELWLTHFSPAVPDPYQYRSLAQEIFNNTVIGRDRMVKELIYED